MTTEHPTIAQIASARGTSLTALAGQMRPAISREHLSRLCNRRSPMSLSQVCQLAHLLDVDVLTISAARPHRGGKLKIKAKARNGTNGTSTINK
jgi:hypothetical protein